MSPPSNLLNTSGSRHDMIGITGIEPKNLIKNNVVLIKTSLSSTFKCDAYSMGQPIWPVTLAVTAAKRWSTAVSAALRRMTPEREHTTAICACMYAVIINTIANQT